MRQIGSKYVSVRQAWFTSLELSLLVATASVSYACGGAAASGKPPASADERLAESSDERSAPEASAAVKAGEAKLAAGDFVGAKAAFEAVLAEDPRDARAALDLGIANEELNDAAGAEAAYRKALAIAPDFPEAQNNLGVLLRERGELEEAVELLERAVQTNPDSASAHQNLALALEDSQALEPAAAEYRKALELSPDDAMTRTNYGMLLLKQGQKDAAARELSRALSQTQDRAALVAIGNGLRRAGDAQGALRAMRAAVAAGEPTPALSSELALAQRAAGQPAEALATLERVLVEHPRYAVAHYLMGNMLAADGKYAPAKQQFERYLKLEPNGEHAANARERLQVLQKRK